MAKPLSALRLGAQDILHAIGNSPDNEQLLQVGPDDIEFEGYSHLAEVMRQDRNAALQMVLHGSVPDESQCAAILLRKGWIARNVAQALWTAERPPIPDLRTIDGARQQYDAQRILLASGGLPVPDCFDEVQHHLATPAVKEYLENGARLLLLVPRRPLADYALALEAWLRENVHLLNLPKGTALSSEPVFCADRLTDGLEYRCPKAATDGRQTFVWRSEKQWLAEKQADIVVAEPVADLPDADRHRSAEQAWGTRRPGEVFLTPQAWAVLFRTMLERGVVLDAGTWSILAGARSTGSEHLPFRCPPLAGWNPGGRVAISWMYPGDTPGNTCVRGAR